MNFRKPRSSDQSYIASTWARSMLSTHAHQRHGSMRNANQVGKLIDRVLDRKDTRAYVCVADEDDDYIVGWVLYCEGPSVPVVHYVYVRREERQRGIAEALLEQIGVFRDGLVVCTSNGPSSNTIKRRYPAATFVPLEEFLR